LLGGLFGSGCATIGDRFTKAKVETTKAQEAQKDLALVDQAVQLLAQQPPFPDDCKSTVSYHVVDNDRLDVALDKVDLALSMANRKILRCAEWGTSVEKGINSLKKASNSQSFALQ
jgi:hypothetical protein